MGVALTDSIALRCLALHPVQCEIALITQRSVVQIHPPQPTFPRTCGRQETGALSISPRISPRLICCNLRSTPHGLQLHRPCVHNFLSAHAASVQNRTARGPVGLEELQIERLVSASGQARRNRVGLEQQSLEKPLGIDRATREPLRFPVGRFSCEVRNSAQPAGSKAVRESRISRRSRMPDAKIPDSTPYLLTERQAAEWLRHSLPTLRRWRRAGRGPSFVRFGRVILYRREELEEFVTAHLSQPMATP